MSLIVARQIGRDMYLVGDTKLTYPETDPVKKLAAPADGIIKITIVNHQVCIAFAGERDAAHEAIKVCRRYDFMVSSIKDHLLQVNKDTEGKTEFILCVGFPEYTMYEIKNRDVSPSIASWIGSQKGYSIFQEMMYESRAGSKKLDAMLDEAMDHVIKSGQVPEVNGFRIAVSNEGNFFHYKNYMSTNMPSRTYTLKANQQHILDIYGTAQEGGYAVSVGETEGRYQVVPVHVRQGEFGVLYEIKDGGLLWPTVITNVDEHEFNELLMARFGIRPQVAFSSLQKSFLKRGNRKFVEGDYYTAINFYDNGLQQKENSLRLPLIFNKALALLKLDRVNEACLEFDKAAKADTNLEKTIQLILGNYFANPHIG